MRSGITSQEISLRLEEKMDGKVGKDLLRGEGAKRPAGQERFIYLAAAAEIRVCDDREGRQSVAAQPTKDSRCAWRKRWTVRSARICEEAKVPNGQQDKNDLFTSPRPRKSAYVMTERGDSP